ncbi:hypothetical protein ACEYXF_14940 [Streptomyces asiaticus]|uniref:hypothetical protein n=1 Tax=Streptomyces asiaticus TaxID=114695 RepID=UPI0039BDF10E
MPAATDTVRAALREERTRWRAQVDETTKYLTDHAVQLLFAYRGPKLPDLAVRYSSNARGVWISDRTEEQKLSALQNITQHCHALFFDSQFTHVSASVLGRSWKGCWTNWRPPQAR